MKLICSSQSNTEERREQALGSLMGVTTHLFPGRLFKGSILAGLHGEACISVHHHKPFFCCCFNLIFEKGIFKPTLLYAVHWYISKDCLQR